MKKTRTLLFLLIFFQANYLFAQQPDIIPKPQSMEVSAGFFTISPVTVLVAKNNLNDKAEQLKKYLDPATGFILGVTSKAFKKNCIELRLDNSLNNLGEEGYLLKVNPDKIILSAFNEKGIGWGIQTLRQLLPDQILRQATVKDVPWKIPCLEIKDSPHFKWRGLMLDCNQKWTDNYFSVYWLCQK